MLALQSLCLTLTLSDFFVPLDDARVGLIGPSVSSLPGDVALAGLRTGAGMEGGGQGAVPAGAELVLLLLVRGIITTASDGTMLSPCVCVCVCVWVCGWVGWCTHALTLSLISFSVF